MTAVRDQAVLVEVGRRLREVRERRGWSIAGAAGRSGQVATAAIASWERAERAVSISALVHMADLYGVPVGALMPGAPLVDPVRTATVVGELQAEVGRLVAALGLPTVPVARVPTVDDLAEMSMRAAEAKFGPMNLETA